MIDGFAEKQDQAASDHVDYDSDDEDEYEDDVADGTYIHTVTVASAPAIKLFKDMNINNSTITNCNTI